MDGFKGHDLRGLNGNLLQQLLQMDRVIVTEYVFGNSAVLDALDHGCVVPRVRQYVTACSNHTLTLMQRQTVSSTRYITKLRLR